MNSKGFRYDFSKTTPLNIEKLFSEENDYCISKAMDELIEEYGKRYALYRDKEILKEAIEKATLYDKEHQILEILKEFISGDYKSWYIDINSYDIPEPEYSIIKEWLENE